MARKRLRVYRLGENVRGINKRGWRYESWNLDDPIHHEGRTSLYGSHNFFLVCGKECFGVFLDCAGRVEYDVGYTRPSELTVTAQDFDLYLFEGDSPSASHFSRRWTRLCQGEVRSSSRDAQAVAQASGLPM